MNSFVVVDVETTGLDSSIEHVIELAALRFAGGAIVNSYATYVKTKRDIPPEVSAVHGITSSDVEFAPSWSDVQRRLVSFVRPGELVVAHHAEFDRAFLPCLDSHTWAYSDRFARHLWPSAPAYKNQVLRHYLGLTPKDRRADNLAHRAFDDARITGLLFDREVREYNEKRLASDRNGAMTVDAIVRFIALPLTVDIFRYGRKWYGSRIDEIPVDYLAWVLADAQRPVDERFMNVDSDTLASVTLSVSARSEARAA
jgi:DNA polymerase III epsilon subunit-like protein